MKRSQSVSQQLGGKPSSDLLGLNLFNPSSTPSSASTPTGSHPYAPLQSPPPLSLSPTPQPQPPQSAPPTHPHPRFPGEFTELRCCTLSLSRGAFCRLLNVPSVCRYVYTYPILTIRPYVRDEEM